MLDKISRKYNYWRDLLQTRRELGKFCKDRQVRLYNWSKPFAQDLWLIDFIEKRGLLSNRPHLRVGLYSIFGPSKLMRFDNADFRIFVERENLHKPLMQTWLHRYLDDSRVKLSLGFDDLTHPQYMRFPFWVMWSVFSPTDGIEEIRQKVKKMNSPANHSYSDRKFCAFLCSHNDKGRRKIYDSLSTIDKVDCDGRLFHNNDDLKTKFGDDKLEYLHQYRFNLTPENTNHENYVTEKLFEAIYSGCVPIYNGSNNNPEPDILNQEAILFIEMGEDNNDVITKIAELDSDEKKYMEFACQPRLKEGAEHIIWNYYERLEQHLREIIVNL